MEIVWHGLSCFRLSERGLATVVTDPFDSTVGLPVPKLKADIVTVSHDAPGHNSTQTVKGERRVIRGPGEYEIGGVFIAGIRMEAKGPRSSESRPNTIFVFDFETVSVAHLGDLAYVPSQAQIEDLGPVNIALVPVGGGGGMEPGQAAEVISLIEPSIVVPMHFKTGPESAKLATLDRFLSEMGLTSVQGTPVLKVTKSGLGEDTQVIVLERSG
ncbi:MAG: MBL fold metallo-hydrolase [Anaerolineales bacterium]|nr:MBL fold metallo-hydrolase [Anaerolineales bacterium]